MAPSFSAIVLCHDQGRTLQAAVDSVESQTCPAHELIIVDCGSRDLFTIQCLGVLGRRGLRVAVEARGEAVARNLGAALSSGDTLVLLNGDCVLEPNYLADAAAYLDRDPLVDFVCRGRIGDDAVDGHPRALSLIDVLSGDWSICAAIMRRTLWQAIGGYDEAFSSSADMDFWVSALRRGARGVVVCHPAPSTTGRAGCSRRRMALDDARRVYQKHREVVEACARDLESRKDACVRRELERARRLDVRQVELEKQLAALRSEIDGLARESALAGRARVDWGDLRCLVPLSPVWGSDRGKPLNRYYIEQFLASHRHDITGHVLEVKDSLYTDAFGSDVRRRAVLDVAADNRHATIVADLTAAGDVPSDTFDCFILTQVLNVIYDVRKALAHAIRILRPGGVLLCTVAAVDRMSYEDRGVDGDYWRFTEASLRACLASVCSLDCFEVTTYGNVLACAAHLYGLAAEELDPDELDARDPAFPVIVAARVVKPVEKRGVYRA